MEGGKRTAENFHEEIKRLQNLLEIYEANLDLAELALMRLVQTNRVTPNADIAMMKCVGEIEALKEEKTKILRQLAVAKRVMGL